MTAPNSGAITLTGFLVEAHRSAGDKVALRIKREDQWHELTYAELLGASQRLARELVDDGRQPGAKVVLFANSRPEWVVAYFACAAAGLTVVPLDPQTPLAEVRAVGEFTDAHLYFTTEVSQAALERELLGQWEQDCALTVCDLASVNHYGDRPPDEVMDRADPDDPASIIFTSGTAVDPKGAVLSHANFLANVAGVAALLEPLATDRFLSVLPLNAAFEFSSGLLIPLSVGASLTYAGSLNPRRILATIAEAGATVMLGIPRLYQMYAEMARRQAVGSGRTVPEELHDLFGDQMRVLVSGGAALDPDVYTDFEQAGIPVHEGYGLTEAAPVITVNPHHGTRRGSVGRPLPGVEVDIVAPDEEGVGEIVVSGASVMRCYYRNEAATTEAIRDGRLHTGDLGYLDEDGYLHITGRSKDVIVTSAGKNVYPSEVELRYKGLPHVREMCVVGVKDASRREQVHAVLVVGPDGDGDDNRAAIAKAMAGIAADLPSYQRIQHVHYRSRELPKSASLKVNRDEIRDLLMRGATDAGMHPTPGTPFKGVEEWDPEPWQADLVREIAQITGADAATIGPDHQFDRDLNLDSLMKVELLALLETKLSLALPEQIALKFQTIQDVMDYVTPLLGDAGQTPGVGALHAVALDALPSRAHESHYLRKTATQRVIGRTFRWGARLGYRLAFRLAGRGVENLPTDGPYIIAANHASHLDSAAIISLLGRSARDLHVLGARDYFFDWRPKGWLVSTCLNVLPFDRHENFLRSLGLSQRAVQMGRSLLIFPEGTRSRTGEIAEFKPGLGLLALELDVPVVPTYIHGTYAALPVGRVVPRAAPVHVTFGEPIPVDEYRLRRDHESRYPLYRELTRNVQDAVAALSERARTAQ
ncbi:AMP-binding protein [Candidatus Poribacteria bacterium]|nr:AMP-binding protein [Candidatus Poribacteria bacterium]MBT5532896.1 AMP-binding protein [Candidatus Poribacteria bacterium]MBT7803915.1 AMP-binding protein [Candidatus Poribacteria bacterium]